MCVPLAAQNSSGGGNKFIPGKVSDGTRPRNRKIPFSYFLAREM